MSIKQGFQNGTAMIFGVTCGYPNLDITEQVIYTLEQAGADLIILGIPFSDPTGEGAIISKASADALRAGITTDHVFELVKQVRSSISTPLLLKAYANVIFAYGTVRFLEKAALLGVAGIILPDVPYEEKEEFAGVCREVGLEYISYAAPASKERLKSVAQEAQGFLYLATPSGAQDTVDVLRQFTSIPVVVACGEGHLSPKRMVEVAYADGIIMDSAIMEIVLQHGRTAPKEVYRYAKEAMQMARNF